MTTLRTAGCALGLFALAAGGCTAQARPDLVISSNAELGAMAAELLPDLASRSGMELRAPVRLEERSRAELVAYLEAKLAEELPAEEARDRVDAYALLGLVPEGLDLRGVLLDLYTEQVAGFYEPDSTALFVLDDQPEEALRALLVHELVHAVQDQSADLDALTDETLGSDRATAAQAAIEGHATLVMFEYLTEQMTGAPIDLGQIPDFAAQLRPALEAMNQQFPALANAPRIVREALLFPYIDGAGYVQRLWQGGERLDPFGPQLPLSTEQILESDAEAPISIELAVTGAMPVHRDVMGRLELGVLLEEVAGLSSSAATSVASAWDGDRYVLVEQRDGSRALASVVVWESAAARDRYVAAIASAESAFGGPVSVEPAELNGRPASVLRVGGGEWEVTPTLESGGA
jgi:hypothetical protein